MSGAVGADLFASDFDNVEFGDFRMRLRNAGNLGFGAVAGWFVALSG